MHTIAGAVTCVKVIRPTATVLGYCRLRLNLLTTKKEVHMKKTATEPQIQTALDLLVKQGRVYVTKDAEGRNVYRLAVS